MGPKHDIINKLCYYTLKRQLLWRLPVAVKYLISPIMCQEMNFLYKFIHNRAAKLQMNLHKSTVLLESLLLALTKYEQGGRLGAQWLSGRVIDSRLKGRGFEPHRRHCVVVLEQDTFILA